MASPPGGNPLLNVLAGLQNVESMRSQQNASAAQSLAEQLQLLGAQQQAREREALERQRLALAQLLAQTQQQLALQQVQQAQQAAQQEQQSQQVQQVQQVQQAQQVQQVQQVQQSLSSLQGQLPPPLTLGPPGQLPPPLRPGPQGPSALAAAVAAASSTSLQLASPSSPSSSSAAPPGPVQVGPPLGHGGLAGLAGLAHGGDGAAAAGARATSSAAPQQHQQMAAPRADARQLEPEPEIPRCHLHRKQNKACKFCKAYYAKEEARQAKLASEKSLALEKLKAERAPISSKALGPDDKSPLPNLPLFPSVMLDRIHKNDYFHVTISTMGVQEVKELIAKAEACDTEWRAETAVDLEPRPSVFISSVYRLMQMQLTEAELRGLLKSRSPFVRCAGFLYVRMGMHNERYWELLSESLMDNEEFVPFPAKGNDSMSVGQFAESLLTKDKYHDMSLPRIPVASRKAINKRLVLIGQFRRRYIANLEVLDRFKEPGVRVDVCTEDGEWLKGETVEVPSKGQVKTLKVKLAGGEERDVSLGVLITPSGSSSSSSSDLTRSRGRSAEELLEKFEAQQRDSAVASGKDYCKSSGQHTMRVGGVPFVAGVKRKDMDSYMPMREDEDSRRVSGRSGPSLEHQAQRAAIESKYCARIGAGRSDRGQGLDGPDRMRLG